MVHRRLLADDSRGVGEPLNETTGGMTPYPDPHRVGDGITVSGRHVLLVSSPSDGMRELRTEMDKLFMPLSVFYGIKGKGTEISAQKKSSLGSAIGQELPVNVHLLTLQQWNKNTVLLRLAHQFAVDEDAELSAPVTVDVSSLLAPLNPVSIVEMSLSANQDKQTMLANKIQWTETSSKTAGAAYGVTEGMQTTLNSMEIKTFFVTVQA
jgi:hypothetical protein